MKKLKQSELKKNRAYRASDIEEKQIKKLYRDSKPKITFSRWKVQKLTTE